MQRTLIAVILATVLVGQTLGIATAAPAAETCPKGQFDQQDMYGLYTNIDGATWPKVSVAIYPCDDVNLSWGEPGRGLAQTTYIGIGRLPSGGIAARARTSDLTMGYLDGAVLLGIVPAEPGTITLYTLEGTVDPGRQYRLTKRS